MDIRNYDEIAKKADTNKLKKPVNINEFAPSHPYRLLIIGPSGSGKTNTLLNLLTEYVYYDHIYLYAKTADTEDKYIFLKEYLKDVEEAARDKMSDMILDDETMRDTESPISNITIIQAWDTNLDNLVSVDDLDENKQNLIVFDDMTLEGKLAHSKISEHFIRGRKKNCSYIYIGHSFFLLPKVIRINITDIILFPPDNKKEIQELSKTYASRIEFKEFQRLLNEVRDPKNNDGHDFIYIDTRSRNLSLWLRKGFDCCYIPPKNNDE